MLVLYILNSFRYEKIYTKFLMYYIAKKYFCKFVFILCSTMYNADAASSKFFSNTFEFILVAVDIIYLIAEDVAKW